MHKEGLVSMSTYEVLVALNASGTNIDVVEGVRRDYEAQENREMNSFLKQRVTPSVYKFIKSQVDTPTTVKIVLSLWTGG